MFEKPEEIFDWLQSELLQGKFEIFCRQRGLVGFDEFKKYIKISLAEARFWYGYIAPLLPASGRILEVGAGLGLLSIVLKKSGYSIVALEPGGVGFEENRKKAALLREYLTADFPLLQFPVEALAENESGRFDLIFSNNVLEHVQDIPAAFRAMNSVLASTGKMIHNCPNYVFPYEPHYSLPLLPGFPALTGRLLKPAISQDGCWRSLNFITYRQVKKMAKVLSAVVVFRKSVLHDSLVRLASDLEFRKRHQWIYAIYFILQKSGLLALLKYFPWQLATPMIFVWSKNGKENS